MIYVKSLIEVGGIAKDAAEQTFYAARIAVAKVLESVDEFMCDYGNEE